ncbi:hypothetical protein SS50377_21526 [Spironucleus salmonicida]|uniref:Myb-like DNA-binding domain-containing protein n=1 Tax=Spironucleus salmonicida TaxID=348837 RepID=V6LP65_9EUKA|nr:hypothetical protein SS50377_21526 [Spironucleus salmonicida]|eukprot:EST45506.1 hypothetical protein SS50377_14578 [Spironucleus salmonicida]
MRNHKWEASEKATLMYAVQAHGLQWRDIQGTYFPALSQAQVKFKYYYLKRQQDNKPNRCDDMRGFVVDGAAEKRQPCRKGALLSELLRIMGAE